MNREKMFHELKRETQMHYNILSLDYGVEVLDIYRFLQRHAEGFGYRMDYQQLLLISCAG